MNPAERKSTDPYLQSLLTYAKDVRNDLNRFIADVEAGKPESLQRLHVFEKGLYTLQKAVEVYAAHYAQNATAEPQEPAREQTEEQA